MERTYDKLLHILHKPLTSPSRVGGRIIQLVPFEVLARVIRAAIPTTDGLPHLTDQMNIDPPIEDSLDHGQVLQIVVRLK